MLESVGWARIECGDTHSPRNGSGAVKEPAGGPIGTERGEPDDGVRTLFDRLSASVLIQVGRREAGIRGVDPPARVRSGPLKGAQVQGGLRGGIGKQVDGGAVALVIACLGGGAKAAGDGD